MSQVRMGSAQMQAIALKGMLDNQRAVNTTQEQIASDKRMLTPADDPLAATRVLQLDQELRQTEQYDNTLSAVENRLQREEGALDGVSDLIQRAQEIINESGNGAINAEQRGYMAVELEGIIDNMAQFMNTKDASGEFIFAGFQGRTEPFVKGEDGRYRYQGDEGQREVRIGPATTLAANDSGKDVFMDIPAAEPTLQARPHPDNTAQPPATIGAERVEDPEAFAEFHPQTVVIEFTAQDRYRVRQSSDGEILADNQEFVPGERIEFGGASVRINGEPAKDDAFLVETTEKTGLLGKLEQYAEALRSYGDSGPEKEMLQQARDAAAGNLENAQTRLLETRSRIGARLNTVESAKTSNQEFRQVTQEARSGLADLDYAEAISRLTQESFVLEAAQASYSRVNRLSLFNFL